MPAPYTAIFKEIQTLTTAWLLISAPMAGAGTPADRAVQLSTTIQRSPPSIQLSWSPNTDAWITRLIEKRPTWEIGGQELRWVQPRPLTLMTPKPGS